MLADMVFYLMSANLFVIIQLYKNTVYKIIVY